MRRRERGRRCQAARRDTLPESTEVFPTRPNRHISLVALLINLHPTKKAASRYTEQSTMQRKALKQVGRCRTQ